MTNDPTMMPSDQGSAMPTTDMSSLLGGNQDTSGADQLSQGQPQEQPGDGTENSAMYKQVIDALMAKVNAKYGELNSLKFAGDNKNQAEKNDILKMIFETMKQMGIDPSDQEAINEFMEILEQENPDMYELFTEALNSLLGPEGGTQPLTNPAGQESTGSPQDQFQNLGAGSQGSLLPPDQNQPELTPQPQEPAV